jgi:hypothetical protein
MTKLESLAKMGGYIDVIPTGSSIAVVEGQKFKNKGHYFRGFLNTLESGKVVLPRNTQEVGVYSIDKDKLPPGIEFIVTGLRILFDTTSGIQAGAGVKGCTWKSAAPAAALNGDLVIKQGDELLRAPLTQLVPFNLGTPTSNDDTIVSIAPVLLRHSVTFEINFELAGAAAVDQAYNIELFGYERSFVDRG